MKSRPVALGIMAAAIFLLSFFSPAASMDDPGFTFERMVMCAGIVDREPVAVANTFSADTEEVFCFLEVENIDEDTTVSFVWYYGDREMARVSLPLEKGKRWRTYASKKVAGLKGDWKVELQDSSGIILHTVSFQVQ